VSLMPHEESNDNHSVPSPGMPSGAAWLNVDSLAAKEEESWPELDKVKATNDINWLKAYGWIAIAITVVFTLVFIFSLIFWSAHYLIPEKYFWLSPEQLSKIQSVLFSGGMGAVISTVVRRQMDRLARSK